MTGPQPLDIERPLHADLFWMALTITALVTVWFFAKIALKLDQRR